MHNFFSKLKILYYYVSLHWYYSIVFAKLGANTRVQKLLRLDCPENIYIGKSVNIERNSWLASRPLTGSHQSKLEIGDGTYIGHFAHIYCTKLIKIGANVLMADKVYISDNLHSYENVDSPILQQPIKQLKEVYIGDGAWIGENVCVIGSSIGKGCVIGANSVVTKDIPDYCVAVGSPAKVIKKYDFTKRSWEKVS
jgi:acetyltransferase-like isoleucine patch superfamily enzyme